MVQKYVKLGIVYSLCAFYSVLCIFRLLYLLITKRENIWSVKERTTPPKCLTDGKYGEHKYVTANVSMKLTYIFLNIIITGRKSVNILLH